MTVAISPPTGIASKNTGLGVWMNLVLDGMEKVSGAWDGGDVHDLRVALRRCRTMADALREVDHSSGWPKVKKESGELFRALGGLRDIQVERSWVRKLGDPRDPLRKHMLALLSRQEEKHRTRVEEALEHFDRKDWRKLSRKLSSKACLFPLESVLFQRLALARLNEAVDLHQQAHKKRTSASWHRLRIGIKRFRYIVENFLPRKYEAWSGDLKRMQDLLGAVHDLDVLDGEIQRSGLALNPADIARWQAKIKGERTARIQQFSVMSTGRDSPWAKWRAGLQRSHHLLETLSADRRKTA